MNKVERINFLKEQQKRLRGGYKSSTTISGSEPIPSISSPIMSTSMVFTPIKSTMEISPVVTTRVSAKKVKIKDLKFQQFNLKKYPPKKLNKRMLFY